VQAQEAPLSAIDWLSDSVAAPVDTPPGADQSDIATSALPGPIEVLPLDAPRADAVGLISAKTAGLPRDLWGPATTDDIAEALAQLPREMLPSLRALLVRLMIVEADPPFDAGPGDRLFLARVDTLLARGQLAQAGALLQAAGADTSDRFRRDFDIALLTGTETEACARLKATPEISPTYPTRIFCLARNGDWQAAAVTLETAEALGYLTPAEDLLLARFLDADIIDDSGAPPPRLPSPLEFRMYEAVGEALPTTDLPLAYGHADLRDTRGWKARLEAAERLVRNGALEAGVLFDLYQERRPSASGGVWDRAAAIQALDGALNDRSLSDETLATAWEAARAAGLEVAFARHYGAGILASLPRGDLSPVAADILLLSPVAREAAPRIAVTGNPALRFRVALAQGRVFDAPAPDMRAQAIRQGFAGVTLPARFRTLLAEGRTGEAILDAMVLFSEGVGGDPDGIADAIALLRRVGLEETARRAALELLSLGTSA
jgi:hypothetical protein